jgi:hypothetical protein
MEALAEPGKAYLTESTAALARGFLDLSDLGEFEIKGASDPVRVFELAGVGEARSRLDLAREQGLSRFVGRAEEMAALEEALERAKAGEGAAIGIVAEPGIGKSRLSFEFVQRCRDRGVEVFEAQAQAHGKSIPFMPVLQMLRSFFGIAEHDPEQLAREKIAGRALLLDHGFAEDLPLMFDFLGVPDPDRPVPQMSPEGRQHALGGIVCRLVNAPSRRKTLVLVVEDLHWIDDGSAAMLGDLIESIEGTNTLALVNYRPEYSAALGHVLRLPRDPSRGPHPGGHPRAAGRPGRRRPLARRARGGDPRAHPGQPVLHRGDRPRAGRVRYLEGERGAYACRARSRTRGCRSRCRRSSPPASTGSTRRQAAAAGRLGGRQGGQRRRAAADCAARPEARSTRVSGS